jgi:hypothetical protein
MPEIVATPGAVNANSYATVDEAKAYFLTRPSAHWKKWDDADTNDRAAALISATELLDATLTWTGAAASPSQALAWPRTGMANRNGLAIASNVIPNELKRATAEFAKQLLESNRLADNAIARQGIESLTAGPVELNFRETEWTESLPSVLPDAVKILLPASWYQLPVDTDLIKAL